MIEAEAKDYDTITVTWALGAGEPTTAAQQPLTGIRVYYSTSTFDGAANAMGHVDAAADDTTKDVAGLDPNTPYFFRVAGVNAAGVGLMDDKDPAATATTAVAPEPSVPSNVTARGGDGTFTVSWTAPYAGGSRIKLDHYRVQKRELAGNLTGGWIPGVEGDGGDAGKEINKYGKRVAGDMTSITFMDLDNGTTYQARVLAINDAGGIGDYSIRDGEDADAGDEAAMVGDGDGDMTETPALPLAGILLLGAGLVSAGRRRLQR